MNDNQHIIKTVIRAMVIMALTGFTTLCSALIISLFCKVNPVDQNLLVAFLTTLNGVVGYLTGSLSKTSPTSSALVETKITNTASEPVPTTDQRL